MQLRRTFDSPSVPAAWQGNYVLPGYLRGQRLGHETERPKGLPRGTVGAAIPDYLGFFGLLSNPLPLALGVALGFVACKFLAR